jgi:hypothetical protein
LKGGFRNKFEKGFQRGVRKEIGKNTWVTGEIFNGEVEKGVQKQLEVNSKGIR